MDFEVTEAVEYGDHKAVVPRVTGSAWYSGKNEFWIDPNDLLNKGFIFRQMKKSLVVLIIQAVCIQVFAQSNLEEKLKVQEFIQNDATEMIFIYGAKDTWSATAVHLQEAAVDRGLEMYLLTGGHHGTRISSFPKKTQREIKKTIESWMD